MIKLITEDQHFHLVGTANAFILGKKGRVKSFELETDQGKYNFKIPKKLHKRLNYQLNPQSKLEVRGKIDFCLKKAKIEFHLETIRLISETSNSGCANCQAVETSPTGKKSQILICQKSSCWKQGGETIYERLTEELRLRGLENSVTVKKTGCMGRCKTAPNLVTLPDKTRHQCFDQEKVGQLIETHYY
jgi:(2Fe-2S) ferredoxin